MLNKPFNNPKVDIGNEEQRFHDDFDRKILEGIIKIFYS
jgi:hypothetical protein